MATERSGKGRPGSRKRRGQDDNARRHETEVPVAGNGSMPEVRRSKAIDGTIPEDGAVLARDAVLVGPGAAPGASPGVQPPEPSPKTRVRVELVCGRLADVGSSMAIVGRFEGLPLSGPAYDFDLLLNNWFKRAIDYGMISSRLGELTFVPLRGVERQGLLAENLGMVGLGEPGRFSKDDLRYLFMNIVYAVKALGFEEFSTALANAPRYGLRPDRALRAVFDGVLDAYDRLRVIPATPGGGSALGPLRMILVEEGLYEHEMISRALDAMVGQNPDLEIEVVHRPCPIGGTGADSLGERPLDYDTPPDVPTVRFTISSVREAASPIAEDSDGRAGESDSRVVFECSAVTETSVIPVRRQELEAYFTDRFPDRLRGVRSLEEAKAFGQLLATYLLPDDFLKILDAGTSLTVVIDAATAVQPWEMAAIRSNGKTSFFGPDLLLTRQFRTLLSQGPGIPPPLDNRLDVLLIADPAPGSLSLPGARREGLAVVRSLMLARQIWGDDLELNLTVRIGAEEELDAARVRDLLGRVPGITDQVLDVARPCDPLEVLSLLLRNQYDVVHYAGHGVFSPELRRKGWVFNSECTLTAREIFKMRQVPRLVFANACLSSVLDRSDVPLPTVLEQQAALAEAFFSRGVANYIGAGWNVNDDQAAELAQMFYLRALGIDVNSTDRLIVRGAALPAVFGEALSAARRRLLALQDRGHPFDTTWGAYQHYGQVNAKLLPFVDADVQKVNRRHGGVGTTL